MPDVSTATQQSSIHHLDHARADNLRTLLAYFQWYRIVEEYSSKHLTKEEDKLIASSGVARQYAARMLERGVVYWAGMWSSDGPHGLSHSTA